VSQPKLRQQLQAVSNGYFIIGGFIVCAAGLSLAIRVSTAERKAVHPETKGDFYIRDGTNGTKYQVETHFKVLTKEPHL